VKILRGITAMVLWTSKRTTGVNLVDAVEQPAKGQRRQGMAVCPDVADLCPLTIGILAGALDGWGASGWRDDASSCAH
jgi:hypothetical protein